jgi:hypothetical protein
MREPERVDFFYNYVEYSYSFAADFSYKKLQILTYWQVAMRVHFLHEDEIHSSKRRAPMKACFVALLVLFATICAANSALATSYSTATFTGHINGGNANDKAPFNLVTTQGDPISGSFIIDNDLIPGANSGFVNVFFSSFPDIALISPSTAFTINLGTPALTFTLADALQDPITKQSAAAIQFNNGQFTGFFFVADFMYSDNKPYRFDDQGGSWSIKLLDAIGGSPVLQTSAKVNGHIDGMTIQGTFTPSETLNPVPEPGTMMLLGAGVLGLVAFGKRRKSA